MKFKLLLLFFIAFTAKASAQENGSYRYYDNNSYLTWGSYYYNKNLKGIGFLMTDLQTLDPELYQTLDPFSKALHKKQREANIIASVGGSIGGIMTIAGFIPSTHETEYHYFGQTNTLEKTKLNFGLIISGTIISIGSVLVASGKWVKLDDILEFTNRFNQHSKGEKLQISMYPNISSENGLSAGLSLCFGF